jgi:hypothetical protein
MREDMREFIRRLEAVGLTVESTPGHTASCARASRSAHMKSILVKRISATQDDHRRVLAVLAYLGS